MRCLTCWPVALLAVSIASNIARAASEPRGIHVIEFDQPVAHAEDGLLLGNGDLSVSVYQAGERIVWRFGKGDVWDRRLDLSDDPKPAHIDEVGHGIRVEGWKCGPYGGPVEATRGTQNPQRMRELCQGAPPSYNRRPYPCPKPVGELALHLPPDLPGLRVRQRLLIEQSRLEIACTWPNGVRIDIECFVAPAPNVLALQWKVDGWDPTTAMGDKPPVWFSLYRWPDPTIQQFAARFFAECRHGAFQAVNASKCTPLPPPFVHQDGDVRFIEQPFPADPTFPDGFRCVTAPLVTGMTVEALDMAAVGEARLHILPPPQQPAGRLAILVATSSDAGGPVEELRRVRAMLADRPADVLQQWAQENERQAVEFWQRSSLRIAGDSGSGVLLENLWYETLHARRCTYRRGKTPPGLFLPSTVRDYSHWHGDYHTNYNFQEPFWGDYTANHLELGDAYFDGVAFMLPIGRKIARDYYGCRGVFFQLSAYPILAQDDPLGVVPMGRMAYMTGWTMNQYWWRYLYTRDIEWLRTSGYPVIRDCALFYTDFLKKGDDGLYHAFPSNQGEDGFSGNPQDYTDRPQVMQHLRYCLRAAIRASELLGLDEELRAAWRDRLDHCAGDDGRPLPKLDGLAKRCFEANPPEFGFGRPYQPQPATYDPSPWPGPTDGAFSWYFGQYPWMTLGRLRAGAFIAERDLPAFCRLVERWRHPNGLIWGMSVASYGRAGAWTESLGVIAPLQEMMLQSWDGAVRVFPAWSQDLDASFENFRAEGAFLVSAAWSQGKVTRLQIVSEQGGSCAVYSPWSEGLSVCDAAGQPVELGADAYGRPAFPTVAGATYALAGR